MTGEGASQYVAPGGELSLSNPGQLELLRTVMERGLPLRVRVRGLSMMPLIRDEDVVTIVPMAGRQPRVGEVVACVHPGTERLVVHRVIAREGGGWLLRGDNSTMSDGVVQDEEVLGSVARVERSGRDVDFGSGLKGAGVARLSRAGVLSALGGIRRVGHRTAAAALRRLQGLAVYRRVGRRLARGFVIREAGRDDLRLVLRMRDPREAGSSPEAPADRAVIDWVAKRSGRIAGSTQLVHGETGVSPWDGHWLFSLWVRGRYRGLGLGEALTLAVVERARSDGAPCLSLAVFGDNERALRLYRKLGFAPAVVDALEPAFEAEERLSGRRRVVMRKDLREGRS